MKSAKVVNKILLISLAFGSVTLVAGMIIKGNLQKALLGVGGTTSVVSLAGVLVTSGNKESDENEENQSDDRVAELDSQEGMLHQSVAEDTNRMQALETNVSSFSTEHKQLWEESIPDPDLNSEEQKLETENDLEVHNDYLNSKFKELTTENEILEQVVSPIEEKSFQDEIATPQNSIEELDEPTENLAADFNPFANTADSTDAEDLSESNQSEKISALEMADKLLGTFEPSGLDEREDTDPENSDELFMEDSDLEEEPVEALGFDDESEISAEYDEIPTYDSDQSSSEMEELAMEYEASSNEMSFEDPSAIATELESNDEFGLNDEPAMSYESEVVELEAIPMADPDESTDAWAMESEESEPAQMSFEEPSAIASELESYEELSFDEPSEVSFETEESDPEEMSFEEPSEIAVELESYEELSFDEPSEVSFETEESDPEQMSFEEPAMSCESEAVDFEAISVADVDSDESMDAWAMESEESDPEQMSFDEEPSAIAAELESYEELSFDEPSEMSYESEAVEFEAVSMADTDPEESMDAWAMESEESDSEEMSFEEPSAIASEPESNDEFGFDDQSSEMSFETEESDPEEINFEESALSSEDSMDEWAMESEESDPIEMSFEEPSAIVSELESNDEFSFDDEPSEMSFETEDSAVSSEESMDAWGMESEESNPAEMSFEEPPAIASELESNEELSFDEPSEMSFGTEESDSEEINFEESAVSSEESMDAWGMESEESDSEEMSFEEPSAIASELESNDEFGFDEPSEKSFQTEESDSEEINFEESAMSYESEAVEFEAVSMADTDPEESMDAWGMESEESDPVEMSFEEPSAIAAELESNDEFSFDEPSELAFESEANKEFSFDDEPAMSSESDDFMGQFIDEDDSSSEDILAGLELDEEAASSSDEFMKELVDDNELALNELTFESESEDFAIASDTDSDLFAAVFSDEDESTQEFSFNDSTDDSYFNELMGAFADDVEPGDGESNTDSDMFDLKFEDDDEHGWNELDSLDAIDQKIDELTELSDDSIGELNDLLDSVQDGTLAKEEELNEVRRDQ